MNYSKALELLAAGKNLKEKSWPQDDYITREEDIIVSYRRDDGGYFWRQTYEIKDEDVFKDIFELVIDTFDFETAKNRMKEGQKVCRSDWDSKDYIYKCGDHIMLQSGQTIYLTFDDLDAQNWAIWKS